MHFKGTFLLGLIMAASCSGSLMGQKQEYVLLMEGGALQIFGSQVNGYQNIAYVDYQFGGKPVRVYSKPNKAYNCFACGLRGTDGNIIIGKGEKGYLLSIFDETWIDRSGYSTGIGVMFLYRYYQNGKIKFNEVLVYDKLGQFIGSFTTELASEYINQLVLSEDLQFVCYTTSDQSQLRACSSAPLQSIVIVNIRNKKKWDLKIPETNTYSDSPSIQWGIQRALLTFDKEAGNMIAYLAEWDNKKVKKIMYDSEKYALKLNVSVVQQIDLKSGKIEELKIKG